MTSDFHALCNRCLFFNRWFIHIRAYSQAPINKNPQRNDQSNSNDKPDIIPDMKLMCNQFLLNNPFARLGNVKETVPKRPGIL